MKPITTDLERTLDLFLEAGRITELRILGYGSRSETISGYFDRREPLLEAVLRYEHQAKGVYFIPNAIKPAALARARNRARPVGKEPTTSNTDIERRLWFYVDLDPDRPSGVCSLDEQHEAAITRGRDIREALTAAGWPEPILADSGNGATLCYRIDLPVKDSDLVKRALRALAFHFGDDQIVIDESLADAAQLIRLYGTINRKGDDTPEQPHRPSRILEAPERLSVVSQAQLEALAATLPDPPKAKRGRPSKAAQGFDLEDWIARHNLDVRGPLNWDKGEKWVFPTCPWDASHTNRSAYILRFTGGAIGAGCRHNSCRDKKWPELRELVEPGYKDRRNGTTGTGVNGGRAAAHGEADDVTTKVLADAILEDDHFAQDAGGKLYIYGSGAYRGGGEAHIRRKVKSLHEGWGSADQWSSHKANEVVEYIRVDAPELWNQPPANFINVQNGLLNVDTGQLQPHSPGFLSTTQLPVIYDPTATCPAWEAFIQATLPEDAQGIIWEIAGDLAVPDRSIQKAHLFVGEGANGKSTQLTALINFLGKANIASLSLHKLEEDRFAAARLVGKLANICPDLPSAHLAGTSTFKALTGGDVITGERKYSDSFDFTPYCRLVFSANHMPASRDGSWAFFRRWLVIPFTRTFEGEAATPRAILDARLAQPSELSGVLNKALIALRQLRQRGEFTETGSMKRAWEEFRQTTDPLSVWLDSMTIEDPNAMVTKKDLLISYNGDAEKNGRARMSPQLFGRALKRHRPKITDVQRVVAGRLAECYLGIGLLTPSGAPEPPGGKHRPTSGDSGDSGDSTNCYSPDEKENRKRPESASRVQNGLEDYARNNRSGKSAESAESADPSAHLELCPFCKQPGEITAWGACKECIRKQDAADLGEAV